MGKTYWFECTRCGYRAKVSGKKDQGRYFHVQTIRCVPCAALYDAVIKAKLPSAKPKPLASLTLQPNKASQHARPPAFESLIRKLPPKGSRLTVWLRFRPQCPMSTNHRVEPWVHPGPCPKCGVFMEMNGVPYRVWD